MNTGTGLFLMWKNLRKKTEWTVRPTSMQSFLNKGVNKSEKTDEIHSR